MTKDQLNSVRAAEALAVTCFGNSVPHGLRTRGRQQREQEHVRRDRAPSACAFEPVPIV